VGIFQSSCIFMYAVVLLFCFYVYIVLHHHIGCRHVTLCRCVYWHCLVYMLPSCYFDWIHVVHRLVSLHMLAQCHVVLMCILMIYVHKSHLGQQVNQGHVSCSYTCGTARQHFILWPFVFSFICNKQNPRGIWPHQCYPLLSTWCIDL